jgi:hypothetical protein
MNKILHFTNEKTNDEIRGYSYQRQTTGKHTITIWIIEFKKISKNWNYWTQWGLYKTEEDFLNEWDKLTKD